LSTEFVHMSKDRAVGKNGGDFAIVCKSCGLAVMQDKECPTKLSKILLELELNVGHHTFLSDK